MKKKDELSSTKSRIARLKDKAYRDAFVASQISVGLPFQIPSLREKRNMKQADLAQKTGMLQPRISAMESPGGAKFTLETLRRIASAFDVALIVRFAPFSEILGWSERFQPDEFSVPSFEEDFASGQLENDYVLTQSATHLTMGSNAFAFQHPIISKVVTIGTYHSKLPAFQGGVVQVPKIPPASEGSQTSSSFSGTEAGTIAYAGTR